MVYLPLNIDKPVHKNYHHFNLEHEIFIEDNEENILIIPEQFIFLKHSLQYKNIKKIIWWLSLDNYYGFKFRDNYNKYLRSLIKIPYNFISLINKIANYRFGILGFYDYLKFFYSFFNLSKQAEIKQAYAHFTQSYYVHNFLRNKLNNIFFFMIIRVKKILNAKVNIKSKKNIICYSHKSNQFIKLLKNNIKIKFIELKNLTSNQILNILKKTKIYLDFGYHPGKDKMPREAAVLYNCIITNFKGSAYNKIDIPISKEFKFVENHRNIKKINLLILKILNNHQKYLKKFNKYRSQVLKEKNF